MYCHRNRVFPTLFSEKPHALPVIVAAVGDIVLKGGKGNDLLLEAQGNAWMSGGQGEDVFAFLSPDLVRSKITDFSVDDDLFMINPYAFEGVPLGFLTDDQLKTGKHATTPEEIIIFQKGRERSSTIMTAPDRPTIRSSSPGSTRASTSAPSTSTAEQAE